MNHKASSVYTNGMLSDAARKQLWNIEIDILSEIDRICNEHGLQYFLAGGALIGAIRHNGFIPWDDDIDICMLREDFDKFLIFAKTELSNQFYLQDGINENGYFDTIVRIRDNNSTGIIKKDLNSTCNNGIFVEIYPLDFVNDDVQKFNKQEKEIHFYRALLHLNAYGLEKNASIKDIVLFLISKVLFRLYSPQKTYTRMQACCRKYTHLDGQFVDELMTKYNCRYRYEDVSETKYHVFENTKFRIPVGYDSCLRTTYDDYMKLPPENERRQHHNRVVYYNPFFLYTDKEMHDEAVAYFKGEI